MTPSLLGRRPRATNGTVRRAQSRCAEDASVSASAPLSGALLTITGPNRPGLVAELFAQLTGAAPACELADVGLAVLQGRLVLVLGVRPVSDAGAQTSDVLLTRLVRLADDLTATGDLQVQVEPAATGRAPGPADRRAHVTLLGNPVPADALSGTTQAVAAAGGVVDRVWHLPAEPPAGVDLIVCAADPVPLCAELARLAAGTGADVAVQYDDAPR